MISLLWRPHHFHNLKPFYRKSCEKPLSESEWDEEDDVSLNQSTLEMQSGQQKVEG